MGMNEFYDVLDKLQEKAIKDLKIVAEKPEITPTEWGRIKEVLCIIKDIKEYDGDQSGYSMRNGSSSNSMGYSTRLGRSMNTGRYISRDYNDSSMQSQRGGYSQHSIKDRMISELERMMDDAQSEYEREIIHNEIVRLEMEK